MMRETSTETEDRMWRRREGTETGNTAPGAIEMTKMKGREKSQDKIKVCSPKGGKLPSYLYPFFQDN